MPEVISGAMRPPFASHKRDADRSRLAVRQEMRRVSEGRAKEINQRSKNKS